MVNGNSIMKQAKEFTIIVDTISYVGMSLDPILHVNMMIFKLPPFWHDYKTKLMYHLRVKELAINEAKKPEPFENAHVVETESKG